MRRRFPAVVLVAFLVSLLPGVVSAETVPSWRDPIPSLYRVETIVVGDQPLTVFIAETSRLMQRGLGYRDGLADGTGMLFVYGSPSPHTFWMKGMRFCIDIIWINDARILGAAESVCPEPGVADADLARYPSPEPSQYVLEVPAGWLAEHGFGLGTRVEIPEFDPA